MLYLLLLLLFYFYSIILNFCLYLLLAKISMMYNLKSWYNIDFFYKYLVNLIKKFTLCILFLYLQ